MGQGVCVLARCSGNVSLMLPQAQDLVGCLHIVLTKKRITVWMTLGPASESVGSVFSLDGLPSWNWHLDLIVSSLTPKSLSLSSTPVCPG